MKLLRPEICAGDYFCLLLGVVGDLGQMSINVKQCVFFFLSKIKGTGLGLSQQILHELENTAE